MSSRFILNFLVPQLIAPSLARKTMNEGKDCAVEEEPVDYHPMTAEGQDQESFDSQGIPIHYPDYSGGFGYPNAASKGG